LEWIANLNNAINYMEEHITEEIDYTQLAKIACCSSYHFQRMFAYMAGIPLNEYLRRRRMSLAAVDLQTGGKIIDVSLKYGYTSPTAFNRAFQSVHDMPPSLAKEAGTRLKSFPPISFTLSIKGAEEMNYRIEQKPEIRIVGVSRSIGKNMEENFQIVPQIWQDATMGNTLPQLCALMDSELKGILGVTLYNNDEDWRYCIAVASSQETSAFETHIIPAATWAIFPGSGTSTSIQELLKRIVTEWIPASGYEYGNAADIEVYLNPDPQNAQYEVWMPVIKK